MDEDAGARRRMDAPDGPQPTAQMRTSRSEFMIIYPMHIANKSHVTTKHTEHISKT
jgi:hypothetical protein